MKYFNVGKIQHQLKQQRDGVQFIHISVVFLLNTLSSREFCIYRCNA